MILTDTREGMRRSLSIMTSEFRQPHAYLKRLLDYLPVDTPAIGGNDPVQSLQRQVSELFGKEAALLLPTGKMAQQIALRIHADDMGRALFAAHPTCHVVDWEYDGYSEVHGLRFRPLGDRNRLLGESDIASLRDPVAAVLWELPQREIGGISPPWEDLQEQINRAHDMGARAHMDGARIWEAQTFYRRPFAEICAPFDSVYVSLYKTLGTPCGALLIGSRTFINRARIWAVRLGGESSGNWMLGASGLLSLHEMLPRLPVYRDHALALAAAINRTGIALTVPRVPQTPFFFVRLPVSPERAVHAHAVLCKETGLEVFRLVRILDDPDACSFEISVAEAALVIDAEEIAQFLIHLVARAREEASSKEIASESRRVEIKSSAA